MALSRRHKVPVRWNESRSENAQATIQGRGQIQHIDLAADADGKLTALRVRLVGDMGAYLQLVTPGIPLLGAFLYAGVYDLPAAYDFECTSVFTTMTPTDAYRGAGRPRRRTPSSGRWTRSPRRSASTRWSFAGATSSPPTSTRTRPGAASSTTPATTTRRRRWPPSSSATTPCGRASGRRTSTGATKRLGIGVSSYFEMCGLAPSRVLASLNYSAGGWEAATVRVLPTSKVQVVTGTAPARPGPRDGVVDDRRRQARHQPRRHRRAAQRHGDRPARPRHLRLALAARRRRRHRHGVRQGDRQGQADRRPPAGGERRRPRVRRRARSA